MSRIGKNPVAIPSGVTVTVSGDVVKAKGKAGEASAVLNKNVKVTVEGSLVKVEPANDTRDAKIMWGTGRALVAKVVKGAAEGYTKNLDLVGVGYKAAMQGNDLVLSLGFSHEIRYKTPAGIKIAVAKPTEISISGADAQQVGQVAAEIRGYKGPEPYKGKGVMYQGEKIRRKEGKKK
jgi:large subunit ribosomal protein L6